METVLSKLSLSQLEIYQFTRRGHDQKVGFDDFVRSARDCFLDDPNLHRKIISNPYSSWANNDAISILGENSLSENDFVRAVVLA